MFSFKCSRIGRCGLSLMVALAVLQPLALAKGGGNVLPPHARPLGYTLADMARTLALFDTSGEQLQYYPKTPFQILYQDLTPDFLPLACPYGGQGFTLINTNTFTVASGAHFFVPLQSVTDSPPIIGNFPTEASQAADYFFSPTQVGARNYEIIVDGKSTPVGPDYIAGPVFSSQPLLDGGGHNLIQLGVFLTPMSVGVHNVTIRGEVVGTGILAAYGSLGCLAEDITYTVTVVNHGQHRELPSNLGPGGRHQPR